MEPMKIAVTGGPTAGKTALIETLFLAFSDRLGVVQEAASFLFRAGFPRYHDEAHICIQERAIYHMQNAFEDIGRLGNPNKVLLCDRGSLDGLAYWPKSKQSYFAAIDSTMEKELARYDWVLHIDVQPPFDIQPNRLRSESEAQILEINERLKDAWSLHPRRCILPADIGFVRKLELATELLDRAMDGRPAFRQGIRCLKEHSGEH
jgi:AAA domain